MLVQKLGMPVEITRTDNVVRWVVMVGNKVWTKQVPRREFKEAEFLERLKRFRDSLTTAM